MRRRLGSVSEASWGRQEASGERLGASSQAFARSVEDESKGMRRFFRTSHAKSSLLRERIEDEFKGMRRFFKISQAKSSLLRKRVEGDPPFVEDLPRKRLTFGR